MPDFSGKEANIQEREYMPILYLVCPDCGDEISTDKDTFTARRPMVHLRQFDKDFLASWPCFPNRNRKDECDEYQRQQMRIHGKIVGKSVLHAVLTGTLPTCETPQSARVYVENLVKKWYSKA